MKTNAKARARLSLSCALGAAVVAACGGSGTSADLQADASAADGRLSKLAVTSVASGWVAVPRVADALMDNLVIPDEAPTKGMWSARVEWSMVPLHATLMPDGRLLTWGTNGQTGTYDGRHLDLWDPSKGFGADSHEISFDPTRQNSFCGASVFLPDGRLMISGGNSRVRSAIYAPADNSLTPMTANMSESRWYATLINNANGEPVVLGGMEPFKETVVRDAPDIAVAQGLVSLTPEVFRNGGWQSLLPAYSRDAFGPDHLRAAYPRAWVAPNGLIFGVSSDKMWYLDTQDNGSISTVPEPFGEAPNNETRPNVGPTNSAVMYAPGKILIAGGNGGYWGEPLYGSTRVTSIDINGGAPVKTEKAPMAFGRRYGQALVLPTGKVLMTGGTLYGNSNGASSVLTPETWDPITDRWTAGAKAAVFRGYHSLSVLLPNGTVLSGAGGAPGPELNFNVELYYPSYLFRTVDGKAQLAPRPVLKAISGLSFANRSEVQVDLAGSAPIRELVLIGLSRGTHNFNAGQRRVPLDFTQNSIRLTATVPASAIAPPGYYQLIAIDHAGVPSRGVIIGVGQGLPAPQGPSTPYLPPDLGASANSAPIITAGGTARFDVPAQSGTVYSWSFGDGSPATAFSANPAVTHVYSKAGVYAVTLTARNASNAVSRVSFVQAVAPRAIAGKPTASGGMMVEVRVAASTRVWTVNPDNDSVTVIDTATQRTTEVPVGRSPRSVALAPDGRIWVVNKTSASLSIVRPDTLSVAQTVALPVATQPHGLAFSPDGSAAFIVLEAGGRLLKLDARTLAGLGTAPTGDRARHVSVSADSSRLLVTRFITPPLPGESTAVIDTRANGGEVLVFDARSLALVKKVVLRHSDKADGETQGAGVPNYLGAAIVSPDGSSAWVPSKQDNIKRGPLRSGMPLDFQNTVRAISSRIDLATLTEDGARRVDHDNASVASAAAFHPSGAYLFVTLETSREVAVLDAAGSRELFRFDTGRAPQALALSPDGSVLYVQNFMDRSVAAFDLAPLTRQGRLIAPALSVARTVTADKLPTSVLQGKRLFYDARDPRLARDGYMSCASCHSDAGHDGRVWDMGGAGEGLRNTPSLRGRAGMGHGFLHWSSNFDEVQDFEKQIRDLAGGTGLMSDAAYAAGTRSLPLGDRKAGLSVDLDALAAYVASLDTFDATPSRARGASLSPSAAQGKAVFSASGCAACHGGPAFSSSGASTMFNIGTVKPASGQRLGGTLHGIDPPTLRDAWATAPYLHDGSAPTLAAAVQAHQGTSLSAADLASLVAYLREMGDDEPAPSGSPAPPLGLTGSYFSGRALAGAPVMLRNEAVDFDWSTGTPDERLATGNFSVRWTGSLLAPVSGRYVFSVPSGQAARLWVNGVQVIGAPGTGVGGGVSAGVSLNAAEPSDIVLEYLAPAAPAVAGMRLGWQLPGQAAFAPVPVAALRPSQAAGNGLFGVYFNNETLSGPAVIARTERLDFNWGTGSAGPGLNADAFSARWTGYLLVPVTGKYTFQTVSDDGVRVLINGVPVIENWTPHATTADRSAPMTLYAGQRVSIAVAYFERGGDATLRLGWLVPGAEAVVPIPAARLQPAASLPPGPVGSGLLGSYFNNTDFAGVPALTRPETPDFDWGQASPGPGVNSDNFTVRWTGTVVPTTTGAHLFQTLSDDGVRVWVNGARVIDNWNSHAPTRNTSTTVALVAGQPATIVVEYLELGKGAVMRLGWQPPGQAAFAPIPLEQLFPSPWVAPASQGTGLQAHYFANRDLAGPPVLQRVEAVDFDWGTGSPGPGVPADGFSARWTGVVVAPATGLYRLKTRSDDGVRVWLDNEQVLNHWGIHAPADDITAPIYLVAGQAVPIAVEYFEADRGATLRLQWQTPGAADFSAIPAQRLFAR